jgi:phage recombination protein Bet
MKQKLETKAPAPQPTALAPLRIDQFERREVIDAIKQTVCRGATDAQLRVFMEVCRATGLNPFIKGEIWYVAEKGIIMAGRDGYLRIANEHPAFDGMETRVERDERGVPIKAVCTVWRKDRDHPTISEAYYSEYKKASPVWQQYPSAMISKVAETLALKRSFAINGVVTEEEVGHEPAQEKPQPDPARQVSELEAIQAGMRDRASIGDALHSLLDDLAGKIGNEAAQTEFRGLLSRYGVETWEGLRTQKTARKFAGELFALVEQAAAAAPTEADPELFEQEREAPYAE